MQRETAKENLFFWPLNLFPYAASEGAASNYPFPKYENGDIFLPWGELGVITACAFVASLLAAFLPAWQAGRVAPADALRYE